MSIYLQLTHSLEKVFPESSSFGEMLPLEVLKNDQISFQLLVRPEALTHKRRMNLAVRLDSPIAPYITVRKVQSVPVRLAAYADDENYLSVQPGLYPDLLEPLYEDNCFYAVPGETTALWIETAVPSDTEAGTYPLRLTVSGEEESSEIQAQITVLDACLQESSLKHTEWFHCDGLAQYYHEEVWSDRFFELVRRQVATAVRRGITMLLTPLWTPPLDTRVGHERLTTQLLEISLDRGVWSFSFDRLKRFMDMAAEEGIRWFEMSHLFTQWGAKCCPKIMATVDSEYRRVFGWDTEAAGPAYAEFLQALLPQLTAFFRETGYADRVYFHISDEPSLEALPQYQACRRIVEPLLQGFPIMDAMSDYSYFEQGVCQVPVVATNHLDPFLQKKRPEEFWVYYCCGQGQEVSNRFIAMPSARTRILGVQLYKFQVQGFLQWGYNFYNSVTSIRPIDPFATTDGEEAFPAGDPFVVYPGPAGEPWESLRLVVFSDGLADLRALQQLEKLTGREHVLSLIEEGLDEPLSFTRYPKDAEYLLRLRQKVNREIAGLSSLSIQPVRCTVSI